jgi:hypothetical protein
MIESIPLILTGLGLTASIVYYTNILSNANKTRELQLKNQEQTLKTREITFFHNTLGTMISSSIGLKNMSIITNQKFSSYEEWEQIHDNNPDYREAWLWMFTLLDLMGIYLKEGVIDIELFALSNPWYFISFWNQYEHIFDKRKETYGASYFQNMKYFFDEFEKYMKKHPELAL